MEGRWTHKFRIFLVVLLPVKHSLLTSISHYRRSCRPRYRQWVSLIAAARPFLRPLPAFDDWAMKLLEGIESGMILVIKADMLSTAPECAKLVLPATMLLELSFVGLPVKVLGTRVASC